MPPVTECLVFLFYFFSLSIKHSMIWGSGGSDILFPSTLSNQRMPCIRCKNTRHSVSEQSPVGQYAVEQHLAQDPEDSCAYYYYSEYAHSGMEYTYLHWSKLNQCKYAMKFIPGVQHLSYSSISSTGKSFVFLGHPKMV